MNHKPHTTRPLTHRPLSFLALALLSSCQALTVGCFQTTQVVNPAGGAPITQIHVDPRAFTGQMPGVMLPQGPTATNQPINGVPFQAPQVAAAPQTTVAETPVANAAPVVNTTPAVTNAGPSFSTSTPLSLAGVTSGYDAPVYTATAAAAAPVSTTAGSYRADDNYSLKAVTGSPDANQVAALRDAVEDYPASYLRTLTLRFPNAEPPPYTTDTGITGYLRGEHNPNDQSITMYRLIDSRTNQVDVAETALVLSHEIAHHVMDTVQPNWATNFKRILASALYYGNSAQTAPRGSDGKIANINRANVPPTDYAFQSAERADVNEVAAEAISFYLQGRWQPQDANVLSALVQMKNAKFANANVDTGRPYTAG